LHIVSLIIITRLSEWRNERSFFAMMQNVWTLPCIIALRFWPNVIKDAWGTYALITVLLAYPYCRMNQTPYPSPLNHPSTNPPAQTQST
jgi:hypothetical protein